MTGDPDDPDEHRATWVLEKYAPLWAWLRKHVTPARLGTVIVTFASVIAYAVNEERSMSDTRRAVQDAQKIALAAQQKADEAQRGREDEHARVTVLQGELDWLSREVERQRAEVERQRAKWERVEELAGKPASRFVRRRN